MKHLVIIAGIFLSLSLAAQMPMGGMPQGGKGAQSVPSIGHIYGKLVDSLNKPIGDASVVVLQSKYDTAAKRKKEVLLKGMVTKENGDFSFEELPIMGPLKVKISATGFKPYEQTVTFQMKMGAGMQKPANGQAPDMSAVSKMMNGFDKDLGNITLKTDVQQLGAVTVTAVSGRLKMDIDKKTFSVDKNIVSAGGTALDVMKNVPSVQVDIDGNVKLRNAAPQLFIDGRPTTLSLDQIPADAIESVEVITNPSAKYDASGGNAGILNIILKKNKKIGYNGNIMAGVDKRGGMNGGGNFSVRQNKFNFTANAMTNQMRNRNTGTLDQYLPGPALEKTIHQSTIDKTNGGFMFGSVGVDYFVTNRTTLSLTGIKVHGEFKPNSVVNTDTVYNNGTTVQPYYQRASNGSRIFNANGLQFGMKHLFPKAGEEITADGNFFSGKNTGSSFYTTDYYDKWNAVSGTELQKAMNSGNNKFLTVQTDYVNPITDKLKLETGLRAQFRNFQSDNETYIQDTAATEYSKITSDGSNYKNNERVFAAYATITNSIKNFGYKVGLRAESSDYTGNLLNTGAKFTNSYPISLFPSLFLSQKLNNQQEVQVSYTRRINRPNFFNLIPYVIDRSSKVVVMRGNPDLVPEFTNSMEASYSKTFKGNNNILASIYYKHTNNLITQYFTNEVDPVTGAYIMTFINANSSYATGAEFTSVNYLKKWWDVTTNINVYNSKINTDNTTTKSQDAMWSWFGKINNNFKLPKNFTIQLSGNYQSKTNLPVNQNQQNFGPPQQAQSASQGYIRSFWAVDAAIRKSFLKNNAAAVTLSFSDIFRTRIQDQHSVSAVFVQDYSRLNNPQMIRLNFTYRFGKMDMSLFKRKNMNSSGMQGATEGMGQ